MELMEEMPESCSSSSLEMLDDEYFERVNQEKNT